MDKRTLAYLLQYTYRVAVKTDKRAKSAEESADAARR